MKRDFDLIRAILIQAEAAPAGSPCLQVINYDGEGCTAQIVAQHVALMSQYGLIEARVISVEHGAFAIGPLTWEGHDFLAAAENTTVWNNVMEQLKTLGVGTTLAVVKGLLSKEALRLVGLGP